MAILFPSYVALKSSYNNKYLRFVHEEGELQGYVQFTGDEVVSPYTKFQVEVAKSDTNLFHLRSCYSNKYLSAASFEAPWILANADKPDEDRSKWSCTMFQPMRISNRPDNTQFRFFHVGLQRYLMLMRQPSLFTDNCVFPLSESHDRDGCDVASVLDWDSLVILPRYIAFKGDNDQYLGARDMNGHRYLPFSARESGDPTAAEEAFTTPDGHIGLKSTHFGKFWRRTGDLIEADADSEDAAALFSAVKIGKNVIALRNVESNGFCERVTEGENTDCLSAVAPTATAGTRLVVTELVASRTISDVKFHLNHGRIYGGDDVVLGYGGACNPTDQEKEVELQVLYNKTESRSWKSNASLSTGVETTLKSAVPFITEDGKIGVLPVEVTMESYQMGEIISSPSTIKHVYISKVPPMTSVTMSAVGTTASFDVPFSYTQTDKLTDGRVVTYRMEDGKFTGVNTVAVNFETEERKLDAANLFKQNDP